MKSQSITTTITKRNFKQFNEQDVDLRCPSWINVGYFAIQSTYIICNICISQFNTIMLIFIQSAYDGIINSILVLKSNNTKYVKRWDLIHIAQAH